MTIRDRLTHVVGVGEVTSFGVDTHDDAVTVGQNSGVAFLIAPTSAAQPFEVGYEIQKQLVELKKELPPGLRFELSINVTETPANEKYLLLELQLPGNLDAAQRNKELTLVNDMLRETPGMKQRIRWNRHPLETGNVNPCFLLKFVPGNKPLATADFQQELAQRLAAKLRFKPFGQPNPAAIRAAISGPDVLQADELAGKLSNQMLTTRKYAVDLQRLPTETETRLAAKIDRAKLAAMGLSMTEVATSLNKALGLASLEDPVQARIVIPESPRPVTPASLSEFRIKNTSGEEIPLSQIATIEQLCARPLVYRVNDQPAVLLDGEVLESQTPAAARELIETLFKTARSQMSLGEEYRLTWLSN